MIAPARVVVNEPWGGLRTNGPIWMLVVEEELSDGHVGGDVWEGAIGRDEFLDNWL